MDCLANLLFFDIQLLYYYTDLNSSIICCLFSGDIYFYFSIFILFSFAFECNSFEALCEWNCFRDFAILLILSAILLPIKSPVASAFF